MSNKRGPHAPAKLGAKELGSRWDYPELVSLLLERSLLMTTGRSSRNPSTRAIQEHLRLNGRISRGKENLKCTALRNPKARWLDSVDHDEIKQQLKGETVSTLAYVKPELGCSLRTRTSGAFPRLRIAAQTWSDTVCALSGHSLRKPRLHINTSTRDEYPCPPCFNDDALRPVDRFHSFHSTGPSGGM